MAIVRPDHEFVCGLRGRTSRANASNTPSPIFQENKKEKKLMTTTTLDTQSVELEAIAPVSEDINLDLDSILADQCEQGLPHDIENCA
jgi:hypothetical protein